VRIQAQVAQFLSKATSSNTTPSLLLAFSGGVDSCVLLHALAQAKKTLNFNLQAMHVHHGLSPNADAWADFCAKTCAVYQVPLEIAKVNVEKNAGLGLEAAAREARYQALLGANADYILLAHHQDDQAETLLLQLLRGAGLKGLSAMALHDTDRRLLRPLLDIPRAEIELYAKSAKLSWIEDESNLDTQYDRNYCRHEVMPVIKARFPAAGATLARSATHLAEAADLLDELAQLDAENCILNQHLNLDALKSLSYPRVKNLTRLWLVSLGVGLPSKDRLDELLDQLLHAKVDASIKVTIEGKTIRRYQELAYLEQSAEALPFAMSWQGEQEISLPDGSVLSFELVIGQGLAVDRLGVDRLRIESRQGGERFKPALNRPTRTLKHLLQESNFAPWLRDRLPLIYLEDTLAVVPGIGVSCLMQATEKEMGLVISWKR
jgi:tRNA(Ile)-lysidine synthase